MHHSEFKVDVRGATAEESLLSVLTDERSALLRALREHDLIVISGARTIRSHPSELIQLGDLFGEPLNNFDVGTPERFLLPGYPKIFINSNVGEARRTSK